MNAKRVYLLGAISLFALVTTAWFLLPLVDSGEARAAGVAWSQSAGSGTVFPACGSASNNQPTCANGSGQISISWNALTSGNFAGYSDSNTTITVTDPGGGVIDQTTGQGMIGGVTYSNLASNTTYTYDVEVLYAAFDGSLYFDHNTGSFTTPNCSLCVSNEGASCTSSANSCGQTNTGVVQCDGSCSASVPADPSGYGTACISAANACGQTNSGTIQCDGSCSAVTPPDSSCPTPDLTAGAVSPTTAAVHTPVTLSATVSNANASTGAGFTDTFQINPTSIPATFADIQSIRTYASGALGAGASNTASASYTFPSAGTWYVRACADLNASNAGTITESNENNNCGPWTAITIGSPSAPSCSLSASGANTNLTLSWTTNNGSSASIDQGVGSVTPVASGSKVIAYPGSATTYTMTVTASDGQTATCNTNAPVCTSGCGPICTTTCCGPSCGGPSLSCARSPSGSPLTAPASVTYTASPSGATAPYTFRDALSNVLQAGSSLTYQTTYTSAGSYAVTVSAANAPSLVSCGTALTVTGGGGCGTLSNTITANPTRLESAGTTNVAWSASGVTDSCVVTGTDGYNNTVSPPSASCTLPNGNANRSVSTQTTYCITCDNNTAAKRCVTVNVGGLFEEF